jgi:electron transfer flavoprotein alpha subunit
MSVLVLVESEGGAASETSRETLTFARQFGEPIHVVVFGDVPAGLDEYAVDVVHQAPAAPSYAPAAWAAAVVAASPGARFVMASGTPRGGDVMAHVACRLGVSMAANVVSVESQQLQDPLVVNRQVLGGSALEEMRLPDATAVLSVAGHAVDPEPASSPAAASVVPLEVSYSDADLRARVVRTEAGAPDESGSLKSAKVVVGAGRGAGSADGFGDLLELTDLLGGVLGVSRVVTSLGWRPHHEQVGQTGSRVSPELYVAAGISGAIQHWAGMSSSKTILAINTDPDAPMVTKAHYAVIGDLHEVVPAINEEIKRRR